MLAISLTIACSCFIYNGFNLHAHPVRGESYNQRNTTGEVATIAVLLTSATNTPCTLMQLEQQLLLYCMRPGQWRAERGGQTGRRPRASKAGGHPKSEIT